MGVRREKKCNLSGTHSFQGKIWGKQWSEEINHGRKSAGEKTKSNEKHFEFCTNTPQIWQNK